MRNIVTGNMTGTLARNARDGGVVTCSDIDEGEIPVRCSCGKQRQSNRRCGDRHDVENLVVRPLGR
jgi:hypothetical protein